MPLVSTPMFQAFTPLLAPPPHTNQSVSVAPDGQLLVSAADDFLSSSN